MRKNFCISVLSLTLVLWSVNAFSQVVKPEKVIKPIGFDISKRLSDVVPISPGYVDMSWKDKVIPNKDGFQEEFKIPSTWTGPDPVLQDNLMSNRASANINQNFSGMHNTSGVAPPDTQGDVGLSHYMQMVNLSFQIWDKSGNSLYGPAASSTLWDGFVGPWTGSNDGDPIVLYDEYADRWIASQFALPNYPSGPFYELVAVSQTGNPTGAWYRYAYEFANMPDYPKFGVWPDGYYMTINQFAPPSLGFAGAAVCVMDRSAMISGDPTAQMLFFNLGTAYGSLLPADVDGSTLPPAGSPNYLANLGTNALRIWEADIDWVVTGNSSVSLVSSIATQSFSYSGIVVNQAGTSQTLDALATRLMYRLQYRNFGTHQVMLANHTVNANGLGQAGVRWYELRNTGSGWTMYQQGTFAPADNNDRWMGSIAMNGNGDIGIGYSVSGSSLYPSIRFTGQTAANSGSGILDVDETSIKEGSYSQTGVNRWGDYSMMSVDPSDDVTFWYTTEYSNGGWNWQTQIAAFSYGPVVVVAPVADFSGNPTNVMAGEQVSFTDLSLNNPTSWVWSFEGGTPSGSNLANPQVVYNTAGTYNVSLTVTNTAGNDTKTITGYITVSNYIASYCPSSGSNTTKEWINTFSLDTYLNNSGSDNGYGNYISEVISLESGNNYSIAMVPGYSGKTRVEYWRVWIDYNADGDFTDNGELVYSADAKKGSVSGSFTIPAGQEGQTRLRVSMEYNVAPSSCDQFVFGEVEDYSVSFSIPVPQPPVADFIGSPTTVVAGNSVQFSDLSINYPTSWSWTFTGGAPSSSADQNPLITYNSIGTFTVSLTATNAIGSDTRTYTGYITVVEGGNYCESSSLSNSSEWITGIDVSLFSNPSGASLYSDFTGLSVDLAPGSTNTLVLYPHTTTQRNFWRIWIDFNADGVFEDSGEQVYAVNNKKGIATGSLSIPSDVSGSTRMRVSMKTGGAPTSCEVFPDGEVEDYTINFGNAPTFMSKENSLSLDIFPNPATNQLNITVSGNSSVVNIKVYNALGQIIDDFNVENGKSSINLGNFKRGIYYIGAEDKTQTTLKKFIKE